MHEDTISLPKIMNGFLNDHIVDIVLWFEIDIFSHAMISYRERKWSKDNK